MRAENCLTLSWIVINVPFYVANFWTRSNTLIIVNSVFDLLHMCHINCQSLFAHLDEVRSFFLASNYHIICLSETWMKPSMSDHLVAFQIYQLFADRTGRGGGDVAFYLSNALQAKIIQQSEREYCRKSEYLIVEISFSTSSKLLLAYRPPHCGYFTDFFNIFMDLSFSYALYYTWQF